MSPASDSMPLRNSASAIENRSNEYLHKFLQQHRIYSQQQTRKARWLLQLAAIGHPDQSDANIKGHLEPGLGRPPTNRQRGCSLGPPKKRRSNSNRNSHRDHIGRSQRQPIQQHHRRRWSKNHIGEAQSRLLASRASRRVLDSSGATHISKNQQA